MASITIRRLDERTKGRLRVRAANNGRSMEEEARAILRAALSEPPADANLVDIVRKYFAPLGGVDLQIPKRDAMRELPRFDE